MPQGKIKEYDIERGYGTLVDVGTGQAIALYANYINLRDGETLKIGQIVEYEIGRRRTDSWAVNVTISLVQ